MNVYITRRRLVIQLHDKNPDSGNETNGADRAACSNLQEARTIALQRAYRKAEAAHPRDDAPKVGSIRTLGLLDTEGDPKRVLRIDKGRS